MADLFISYSRNDSETAEQLVRRLQSESLSVWIDRAELTPASNWSAEIVEAIESAKALLLLLSPHSVQSEQVVREVALAFESKKTIIPVEIEPVTLPTSLRYPLAGIQRTSALDVEAILNTLTKVGLRRESSGEDRRLDIQFAPTPPDPLGRKTLAVLPFEEIKPNPENSWIAEGLMQELINVLSRIERLRVKDRRTVKNFDARGKSTKRIADELGVRYLLDGTVQIYGPTIRIAAELIDSEGDTPIWRESFSGSLENLFAIQERVATELAKVMQVSLTEKEKASVSRRSSANPEVLKLLVMARDAMIYQSRSAFDRAITLLNRAAEVEPDLLEPWELLATAHIEYLFIWDWSPERLGLARFASRRALEIDSNCATAYAVQGAVRGFEGDPRGSEMLAHKAFRLAPNDENVLRMRGYAYNRFRDRSMEMFEAAHRIAPDNFRTVWNLSFIYILLEQEDELRQLALNSLPFHERYLYLHPSDLMMQLSYAFMLKYAGDSAPRMPLVREFTTNHMEEMKDTPLGVLFSATIAIHEGCEQEAMQLLEAIPPSLLAVWALISPFFRRLKSYPTYRFTLSRLRRGLGI